MTITLKMAARTAFVVVAIVLSAHAQEPEGGWLPPIEARPTFVIRASATGNGRTVTDLLTGSMPFGEREYAGMVIMPAFDGGTDLCVSSVTFGLNPDELRRAAAAWFVEGRLVRLGQGEATVDLRWTRQVNRGDIVPADRFTWEQRIVVREGDHGVLDLVRHTSPSGNGCDTFSLTWEVQFEGPSGLATAAIGYDVWLVQRDADGELVTERFETTAKQGEKADYFFRPIPYGADGRRSERDHALLLSVGGSLRGRVRTDGRIDLAVDGDAFAVSVQQSMTTGRRGRTLLTVRPGETVEVEAVKPAGRLGRLGDVGEIFAGHRTAIRITARRLW